MKQFKMILPALTAIILTSCNHKEFCYDHTYSVRIVFDWRYAPDADPESMNAHHFDVTGSMSPQRYSFGGRDGGYITTRPGMFAGIGFNDDINEWASVRNTASIDTYEIITKEARSLPSMGLSPFNVPRAEGAEDERMALTPQMLWCNKQDDIDITFLHGEKVITYYPEEAICYYTVTVYDIDGFEYLRDKNVDATLSGMAEGFMPYPHLPSPTKVTHPYVLSSTVVPDALYSEFLTFGVPTNSNHKHYVTLYTVYEDGKGEYHTYDVTDQVRNAPDPRHVDIVIRGLDIPKPIGGGGLDATVNEWINDDDVKIEL